MYSPFVYGAGLLATLALYNLALAWLTPGAQPRSRWLSTAFLWVSAPAFWLVVKEPQPALWGTVLLLANVACAVLAVERGRLWALFFAFAGTVAAWWIHPVAGGLSIGVVTASLWWLERRDWHYWPLVVGWILFAATLVWFHPVDWQLEYWGQPLSVWGVPQLLYVWLLPIHPYGCMLLPLLLLIGRRTDVQRSIRRVLGVALFVTLLFAAGLPSLGPADLLPLYVLLILLFFPAWDRVISYGFYFLGKKWMALILGTVALVQVLAGCYLVIFG